MRAIADYPRGRGAFSAPDASMRRYFTPDKVFRKPSKPLRCDAEPLANVAMSAIAGGQVVRANDVRPSGGTFLECCCHSSVVVREGDQFGAVAHIAAPLLCRSKQERLEPALRTPPPERVRADGFCVFDQPGAGIEDPLFSRGKGFLEDYLRDSRSGLAHLCCYS